MGIVYTSSKNSKFTRNSQASTRVCELLILEVSGDGKIFSSLATIPSDRPTSYYIKVADKLGPCNTSFSVQVQGCQLDGTACGQPSTVNAWGAYHSDDNGIARIDLDSSWGKSDYLKFRVKSKNSNSLWSNQVSLKLTPAAIGSIINGYDYFITKPGYTYIFNSKNHFSDVLAQSRLQMEEITDYCGVRTIPWRFTKTHKDAYWGVGTNTDLRWFVVDPAFSYSYRPAWNQYFWADSWKDYVRPNNLGIDVQLTNPASHNQRFRTTTDRLPGYLLMLKTIPYLPFIAKTNLETFTNNLNLTEGCPTPDPASTTSFGSWKIRVDMDTVSIKNPSPGFNYDGPALRVDYYEAGGVIETSYLLRESWYFVKGVGLVMIKERTFNNYPNAQNSLPCVDTSDCFANTISSPSTTTSLKYFFPNPKLIIQVSTDGINWKSIITTSKTRGYHLKAVDGNGAPFTGYLETPSGTTERKWLAVDNGVVYVTPAILDNLKPGEYTSPFRIWVPNEVVTGETRVSNTQIPWSDPITVNLTL